MAKTRSPSRGDGDLLQKAPNCRIAHFQKYQTKIQTQNSDTFPDPGVRFWKGVGRWWGRRAVYGWLLVGSRRGNKATGLNCSLVSFHCLPCTVCLEFCEYRLWNTRNWKKKQDQTPFREIFRPTSCGHLDFAELRFRSNWEMHSLTWSDPQWPPLDRLSDGRQRRAKMQEVGKL